MAKQANGNNTAKKTTAKKTNVKEPTPKKFKYRVKKEAFGVDAKGKPKPQVYYMERKEGGKNVALFPGEGVEEEDYDLFTDATKEKIFEDF